MNQQNLGKIWIVSDLRLSRQKTTEFTRVVNALRCFGEVQLLNGNMTEDTLLEMLRQQKGVQLLLLPWYRYSSWKKIEGHFGLSRVQGPTVAGYYLDRLMLSEIERVDTQRAILLDFGGLAYTEVSQLVRALMTDPTRSGIFPLFENVSGTTIYYEDWNSYRGLGNRFDAIMKIPEIALTDWHQRTNSLRVILSALWGLVYEEGPGKVEFGSETGLIKRAYFQLGASPQLLAFRLIYTMSQWTPKDVLEAFWPDPARPFSAAQLLLTHGDFLRVHRVVDTHEIEIVVGMQKSAPAERLPGAVHTMWIEPVSSKNFVEPAYERPDTNKRKNLQPLGTEGIQGLDEHTHKKYKKEIEELTQEVRDLKKVSRNQIERIDELKYGGVGTAKRMVPPEPGPLLDGFQEHFYLNRSRIVDTQEKLQRLKGLSSDLRRPATIKQLEEELVGLQRQEESWIKTLAEMLRAYQEKRKGSNQAA